MLILGAKAALRKKNLKYRRKLPPLRSVKSIVKREIRRNEETKYYTNLFATDYAWNNYAPAILTNVPQGSAGNNRVGDKLYIRSLHLTVEWATHASAATFGEKNPLVRLIIFQWHPLFDSAGSAMTLINVLEHSADAFVIASPYSIINQKNFTVLYDKTIKLGHTDDNPNNRQITNVWITGKKFMQREIHYYPASSSKMTNGIYMAFVSEVGQLSGSVFPPTVLYHCRLRFTDA